jgi:CheY-like chemotaxis protein
MEARMQEAQKLESLGLLAGGIAHDFNNLLQAVRGHTEILIKSEKYKGTEKEAIEGIDAASRRAADLCRQLLAYAGKGRFTQEVLDVRQVVGEIGKVLEVGLSKKAKLEYFFEDALPPIRGDGTQIRQVFLNLMTNASEALGEGSGSIKVSVRAKVIDAGDISLEPGQYVVIEVTDTGCGMDMETQSRIFEPFFTTKFTGRGLGLAAVRGIVLAHGGALKVHSVLGKGTTMMVYLPAADGVHSVPAQVPAAVSSAGRFSGRVLLADDDNDVRLVTRRMLERLGFQVQEAINGRQAVSAVAEKKDEWAGVVLDLTMPDLDGAEAFHEIRKANPGLPVVLVSGYSPEDVASRVGGNTLFSLIQKPFNQTELESAFLGLGLVKE